MKPTVPIRKALSDPALLGGVLAGDSWSAWRVLLIAAMGEALTDEERETFTKLTGARMSPCSESRKLSSLSAGAAASRGQWRRSRPTSAAFASILLYVVSAASCCASHLTRDKPLSSSTTQRRFEQSPILNSSLPTARPTRLS